MGLLASALRLLSSTIFLRSLTRFLEHTSAPVLLVFEAHDEVESLLWRDASVGRSLRMMMMLELILGEDVLMVICHHRLSSVNRQETMREIVLDGSGILGESVDSDLPTRVPDVILHLVVVVPRDRRLE